jgi:hypothetical protein
VRARLAILAVALLLAGCTRAFWRRAADRETYPIMEQRELMAPAFAIGRLRLEPPPESRLADPTNPDRPPRPPDDPAAAFLMARPGGLRGSSHWNRYGVADRIELTAWEEALQPDENGKIKLSQDRAVEIALMNSRELQTQLEDVYLSALNLTLNRFEFACRWFGRNNTTFTHFGSGGFPG